MTEPLPVVARYLQRLADGDPGATDVLAEDLVLTVRGTHPLAGTWHGRERSLAVIGRMGQRLRFRRVDQLLGGDHAVLAIVEGDAALDGTIRSVRRFVLYGVHDEMVRTIDVFEDDQVFIDELLSGVGSDHD